MANLNAGDDPFLDDACNQTIMILWGSYIETNTEEVANIPRNLDPKLIIILCDRKKLTLQGEDETHIPPQIPIILII